VGGLCGGAAYLAAGLLTWLAPMVADLIAEAASPLLDAVRTLTGVLASSLAVGGSGDVWIWVAVSWSLAVWWTREGWLTHESDGR
jgi:hypothetical protein